VPPAELPAMIAQIYTFMHNLYWYRTISTMAEATLAVRSELSSATHFLYLAAVHSPLQITASIPNAFSSG
jgi:hypothetical protein